MGILEESPNKHDMLHTIEIFFKTRLLQSKVDVAKECDIIGQL